MKKLVTILKQAKPIDIGSFLQAKLHEVFTVTADKMAQMGLMTTEERIALSGSAGDMLEALRDSVSKNAPILNS